MHGWFVDYGLLKHTGPPDHLDPPLSTRSPAGSISPAQTNHVCRSTTRCKPPHPIRRAHCAEPRCHRCAPMATHPSAALSAPPAPGPDCRAARPSVLCQGDSGAEVVPCARGGRRAEQAVEPCGDERRPAAQREGEMGLEIRGRCDYRGQWRNRGVGG